MNAIIIDDESKSRSAIAGMIKNYCPEVNIVAEADSIDTGIVVIEHHGPDLVFLDIQLRNGTGFDLLNELDGVPFKIIFITAHDEFAINAIRFSAIDYLLKPINSKQLIEAVDRAREQITKDETQMKMNVLAANMNSTDKRVVLKSADLIYIKNLKDIIRCEADGNYTNIFLQDGTKVLISKSLKEFDTMLSGAGFFRAHNAHLINLAYIDKVKRARGGHIEMIDGSIVPVAYLRRTDLIKIIDSF